MSSMRCAVCAQEATKKCTDCGEVFCDLHIRLAGGTRGLYGPEGTIGYFCDACWEKRIARRQRSGIVMALVVLGLLVANLVGVFVFRSSFDTGAGMWPTSIVGILITILVLMAMFVVIVARRRR